MTGNPSLPDRLRARANVIVGRLDGTSDARLMREAADRIDHLHTAANQQRARYLRLRNLIRHPR